MPIPIEIEQAIILAAKFTYDFTTHELKIEFDPHPQMASTNMIRLLRDRCDELIVERLPDTSKLKQDLSMKSLREAAKGLPPIVIDSTIPIEDQFISALASAKGI